MKRWEQSSVHAAVYCFSFRDGVGREETTSCSSTNVFPDSNIESVNTTRNVFINNYGNKYSRLLNVYNKREADKFVCDRRCRSGTCWTDLKINHSIPIFTRQARAEHEQLLGPCSAPTTGCRHTHTHTRCELRNMT